ncbi:MAG: PLDc N-terminal domain-containing protein [Chloroflexota bacterium]|nr:PLDc N-terminal domain-containing protein [Chloroflexota bacterium]
MNIPILPSIVSVLNILLLLSWPILAIIGLFKLKEISLTSTAKALWVLIVILVPILGPVALFIINPEPFTE